MKTQFAVALALAALVGVAASAVIEDPVFETLSREGTADVFIELSNTRLDMAETRLSRADRAWRVYNTLTAFAQKTQGPLRAYLADKGLSFETFWIANAVLVRGADQDTVREIAERFAAVESIHLERVYRLDEPIDFAEAPATEGINEWHLDLMDVPQVWAQGIDGSGIVVANIDTGVRLTHEVLADNFRGNLGNGQFDGDYNWYDRTRGGNPNLPEDGNGHGTHTMSSITGVGSFGVSVAPGATWIAGRGCGSVLCNQADLLGSAEFLACPTRTDGSDPDCSKVPHVINNSWGGGQGDTWFQAVIQAWLGAGIVPIFSQGNSGPQCSTANSPADNDNVMGVGATDSNDRLASYSSRGPGVNRPGIDINKPDVSAPGSNIRGAWSTGDSAYSSISGTSMAGPQVAGIAALLLQANSTLTVDDVFGLLENGVETAPLQEPTGATNCAGKEWNDFPSFHYGAGRVNALKSFDLLKNGQ